MVVCVLTVRLHAPWGPLPQGKADGAQKPADQAAEHLQCIGGGSGRAGYSHCDGDRRGGPGGGCRAGGQYAGAYAHFIETHTQAEVIAVERERR